MHVGSEKQLSYQDISLNLPYLSLAKSLALR